MAAQRIYDFGPKGADGGKDLKELLGGKGGNLAEMARLGLPVPPGFTVTTAVCRAFLAGAGGMPDGIEIEIDAALFRLEEIAGARLGDPDVPLLLSVRSGAQASMPGMMDTVLDLGLNERTVAGLARLHGARFAQDCHRRFVALYGSVVLGVDGERDPFQSLLDDCKLRRGVTRDAELDAADLEALVRASKELIRARTGKEVPEDPRKQLRSAIEAVFRSWNNPRAVAYRRIEHIPDEWGTAATVQAMVFGNHGEDSGTGVLFSRDPTDGNPRLTGEFLPGAQGEDVVAGLRTPLPLSDLARRAPAIHTALTEVARRLEHEFHDLMDVEFTVERGKLYVLQCRSAKRTGFAALRAAVDMVGEGLLTREEAVLRVPADSIAHLLRPVFDEPARAAALGQGRLLAHGLPAGPGAASGALVFTPRDAEARAQRGERVILVRSETSPEDVRGMYAAEGLLTARGGLTSHAALVARQMGKVAVVGCSALSIDAEARTATFATGDGPRVLREGDQISLDGLTGEVIAGDLPTMPGEVIQVLVERTRPLDEAPVAQLFERLLSWADSIRRLSVRANADQPEQAAPALALGADGIGLCRTEHMFFGAGKIEPMREMILARGDAERRAALGKLLPLQRSDFIRVFRAMRGKPVVIRTLDPPLHEFLPADDAAVAALAAALNRTPVEVRRRARELSEENPMLGLRGCRLGILYPEITQMQARAIFEAACEVEDEGLRVRPEIMIPLVGTRAELDRQLDLVRETAQAVCRERGHEISWLAGTMIEVPRAALVAGDLARSADFFSFGTNDLTQMTLGLSRDDAGPIVQAYLERGVWKADPFASIDEIGVGELVRIGAARGRAANPELELGVCGEHGGDPRSIEFFESVGLDYVSCSPLRVPIARLAAAQAALRAGTQHRRAPSRRPGPRLDDSYTAELGGPHLTRPGQTLAVRGGEA
jgi:pyruvate, orthophosphate dikinase